MKMILFMHESPPPHTAVLLSIGVCVCVSQQGQYGGHIPPFSLPVGGINGIIMRETSTKAWINPGQNYRI